MTANHISENRYYNLEKLYNAVGIFLDASRAGSTSALADVIEAYDKAYTPRPYTPRPRRKMKEAPPTT